MHQSIFQFYDISKTENYLWQFQCLRPDIFLGRAMEEMAKDWAGGNLRNTEKTKKKKIFTQQKFTRSQKN